MGFVFARRIKLTSAVFYIIAQIAGAVIAAFLLRLLFPVHPTLGSTVPTMPFFGAFFIEIMLSFLLMFVILNVSTGHMEKGIMAGGFIALAGLIGGPLTGASMNPARSFGPALFSGNLHYGLIYFIAPFVGTFLAHPTCRLIQGDECCAVSEQDKK